ncbi:unnamed protein product [Triticum turgidum subsp. durum]|uniref:Uncharacterized protein n=1 Tax=Triticum turgidum subsp. durum TaxID=4567 RepID=A0A9R1Q0Z1_TRITD|nr:unnamed protein product [Triticum turgidum subsp. durum]
MDQHKELEVDVEGEPTDQRKEEEVAGKPEESAGQRKEEEEEREEGDSLREPTDQSKEEEKEDKSEELTEQHKAEAVAVAVVVAEVDKPEELTDQRKEEAGAVAVDKSEELTDQRKEEAGEEKDKETERSSGEESPSLFMHPCSLLLRYLGRAYAWCMGLADWFGGGTRPSAAPAASLNSSREEAGEAADIGTREISKTTSGRVSSFQLCASISHLRPGYSP